MSVHPKLSSINDQFTSDVAQAEPVPKVHWEDRTSPIPSEHYRHNKSRDIYIIEGLGLNANNGADGGTEMVAYRNLGSSKVYFRDIEEFLGLGKDGDYRFVRMVPVDPDCEE